MHLSFAAQPFDIREKMALIGTNGAAKTIIVRKGRVEAERKHGGKFKAVCNYPGVVLGDLLVGSGCVLGAMLRNDDRKVTSGKKKGLIAEKPSDSG